MKSEKNIFIFFNLFNCFKILSVYKSREQWKITDFCEIFFLKMSASPKSSFFKMLYEAFYRDDEEVISQRVPTSLCASLLWSPLHYPVVGSKSSSHSLKNDDLGLVPIFKKKITNLWFSIFSFDLYTDSILKQVNKLKILKKVLGCNVLYFNLMQYMYVRSDYLGLVPLWWQTISKSFACMYCTVM